MTAPRVAFVVQRCGDDVIGGAEALALASARAMHGEWDCTILTTRARDARTWENQYPAGPATIAGVPALRFSVDEPRDARAFDAMSALVRGDPGPIERQEAWMRAQGPYSSELFRHLRDEGRAYDAVFFFSYLYATTYFGLPEVAERSVLVPLAHDEWMLRLPMWRRVFERAAHVAFVSEEERALVETRFPNASRHESLLRLEIAAPPRRSLDGGGFRARHGLERGFGLYVGRVDAAKGADDLVERFARARARGVKRDLVLAGPATLDLAPAPGLHVLGALDEREKWNAYAAAGFAIVPSAFESLSIAALEAWSVGTPVLAYGGTSVLIGQCRRSGAGLWYASDDEFFELYDTALLGRAEWLGDSGAAYVARTFTLERARASLRDALESVGVAR